jgi:hypothetical protein
MDPGLRARRVAVCAGARVELPEGSGGAGRVVEAGVARRGLALGCYEAGDFLEARTLASKRSRPATLSTAARHRNVSTTPLAP